MEMARGNKNKPDEDLDLAIEETPAAPAPPAEDKPADKEERYCYALGLTAHQCDMGGTRYNFNVNDVISVKTKEHMLALYNKYAKYARTISDQEAELRLSGAFETEDI